MRLLHTADWHLKDKLGWVDRTDDLNRSLKEIARLLRERDVEVMLVAGDLFRERLSKEELREAVADLADIFGPWLAGGGTILAVAGNHDNRAQLETLRDMLKLAPGTQRGRIHLFPNAGTIALTDRFGQTVQFLCLPYPDEAFIRGEWSSDGELNRSKLATCQKVLATLKSRLDPALKTVFISHIHVAGVPVGPRDDHHLGAEDDIQITQSDLPMSYAYLAFGHIHKPQLVGGADHARYCGSIQPLDLGEKGDEKGVVLVDISPESATGATEWIPLTTVSAIRNIVVNGEADLANHEPDSTTLMSVIVRCQPGEDNFPKMKRRLREMYPRAYSIREERLTTAGEAPSASRDLRNVHDNVREFLRCVPNISGREHLCDHCEVKFIFEVGGKRFRAERKLRRGNPASCALYEDGKDKPLDSTNRANGFDAAIQTHVGLTEEAFTWTVLLRQGRAEEILDALRVNQQNNSKAHELLNQLIDLSAYDQVKERATARYKGAQDDEKRCRQVWEGIAEVSPDALTAAATHIEAAKIRVDQCRLTHGALDALRGPAGSWAVLSREAIRLNDEWKKNEALLADE